MVTLRQWINTDAQLLATYFNNANIWNNVRDYIPHPYTVEDAEKFIATQASIELTQNFAVLSNEEVVGGIGIILGEDVYKMNVELGYWVAEAFWGVGIATEAVRLMTEYIFQTFLVNRIIASVFEYNKTSMRVLEKNGYFLETVRRKGILKNDYLYDEFVWVKQKII
jgi:[ribosomal protein S5]-alanine N-acetyltransferase